VLRISRDLKDDPILEAASALDADCILTGDKDLLVLGSFRNIPILQPNLFARFEKQKD
jgi:predicted nucleic acid-binding protein